MIYEVALTICFGLTPCPADKADVEIKGMFVDRTDSPKPCQDWLLSQLEYNNAVAERDASAIVFTCKRKDGNQ